jgi:hydrogenase maturation protease
VAIIGVGNVLLSDEGIGVHVVRALARRRLPHRIELIDGGTGGLALLNMMRHRERVIIVDAASISAPPAAVFRWMPGPCTEHRRSSVTAHAEEVQEVLEVGRTLFPLPPTLFIGVVPRDITTPGTALSRSLRRRLPAIATRVFREAIDRRALNGRSRTISWQPGYRPYNGTFHSLPGGEWA